MVPNQRQHLIQAPPVRSVVNAVTSHPLRLRRRRQLTHQLSAPVKPGDRQVASIRALARNIPRRRPGSEEEPRVREDEAAIHPWPSRTLDHPAVASPEQPFMEPETRTNRKSLLRRGTPPAAAATHFINLGRKGKTNQATGLERDTVSGENLNKGGLWLMRPISSSLIAVAKKKQ